jgi:hypothetical protein
MRKLIIVRIVHTPADMGTMKDGLMKEGMAKLGKERWLENQRMIEKFWAEAEQEIDDLGLDYRRVRVYQDGLPVGGELAKKIVDETAEKGSKNYRIVRKMMENGAVLEATESPDLLIQEYGYITAILTARTPGEKSEATRGYDRGKDELMRKRDAYIANRINSTLKDGETGLLFIGAAHNVRPGLAPDIEVTDMTQDASAPHQSG